VCFCEKAAISVNRAAFDIGEFPRRNKPVKPPKRVSKRNVETSYIGSPRDASHANKTLSDCRFPKVDSPLGTRNATGMPGENRLLNRGSAHGDRTGGSARKKKRTSHMTPHALVLVANGVRLIFDSRFQQLQMAVDSLQLLGAERGQPYSVWLPETP